MSIILILLLAASCALIGGGVSLLFCRMQSAALAERKRSLEQDLATARAAAERQASEIRALTEARSALDATLASERRATEEKQRLLQDASEQLKAQFKSLAAAALDSNNANFLQLAKSVLQNYQTQAAGDLAQKELAVKNLVEPISQSLAGMNQQIQDLEKARAEAYGTLTSQVASLLDTQKALQAETGNLVKALREPQARGRWGELQLHRVLELSGMLEYCDFKEQLSFNDDERRYRPDVIVDLPGGKQVVVDAKVPLSAYLSALEAPDELGRNICLAEHARQVRNHIDSLAGKAYWSHLPCTPEFVVLFLPGDQFLAAALQENPALIDEALRQNVMLATPWSLVALLKAVAYGWKQSVLADNALEIRRLGEDLYKRLAVFGDHLGKLGKSLGSSVDCFNKAVGSLEQQILPAARRFPELGLRVNRELEPLEPVAALARAPRTVEPAPDTVSDDGP